MKKIAFLFLIIDNPYFPKIWDKYFKNNKGKYNIYIHPKFPEKLTWKKKCMIKNLKETSWGFITEAYRELFKEAYKDKDNYKFVAITESCVPIQSFDNFYNTAISEPNSWIRLMRLTRYDREIRLKVDGNFIKHSASFCLNRQHVKLLLIRKKQMSFFHKIPSGDEFFLSTLQPLKNYTDFPVTYYDWDWTNEQLQIIKNKMKHTQNEDEYVKLKQEFESIAKHPKTIVNVKEDLDKIKNCKSFFYRKFDRTSNIEKYWKKIISHHS